MTLPGRLGEWCSIVNEPRKCREEAGACAWEMRSDKGKGKAKSDLIVFFFFSFCSLIKK